MTDAVREQIQRLLWHLDDNRSRLAVDACAHVTNVHALQGEAKRRHDASPDYYSGRPVSAEDLIREMDMADVDMALAWQNPPATAADGDPEQNLLALFEANLYVNDAACRFPERFIPAGWIDPAALGVERAASVAERLVKQLGFAIVRLDPPRCGLPIDSEPVLALVDHVIELGATPALGVEAGSPFTPVEGLERVAQRHPAHPIIIVPVGAGTPGADEWYRESRELGLRQTNIRYVLKARPDAQTEADLIRYQLAGAPHSHNLMCASGAPFGRMTWHFGGYRAMFRSLQDGLTHTDERVRAHPEMFAEADVRRYLGGNCADLAQQCYARMLKTQGVKLQPLEPCH